MDNRKPPHDPDHLLEDLKKIQDLLDESAAEPPLLTESFEPDNIPLLSDVVTPAPQGPAAPAIQPVEPNAVAQASELNRLDLELRAAAQLILQDVIDDFAPQIEAELQRRLEARMQRLLAQRKP
ncbi:DNA polymerase III subunit chi [Pseudomonas nitroreducens]|uniref:DNA polymerase III subunit chi n=1 Tax=Pseudomonas nitroreducens TaxID=46680 RepID=A0ABS0KLU5_PSENT|nr:MULTISPECIES: DNA polymerase III subunit chi [Pseudomonas]MBG6289048.1 DNA polymerase III subunit chi [Pseudomonas nitroreducens]MDG9853305.1 DNA polymerase III subunit chi [Pseudomonas nitroreducens]MDH1075339.1 DNA polymerase III subunit chi [Pseudomonas nitroreducens]NMZ75303.1 DNA polymerase III subunit chi [Pseudomonas nitroreducens]NNN26439.1 DNA polymerase III subunit chi [Pseudomonas nitroreducens]